MTVKLLLTHLPPDQAERSIRVWEAVDPENSRLLVAYGGSRENFEALRWENKFFVDDPRLRTSDHQRQFQSYSQLFARAADQLEGIRYEELLFVEFDHWPVRGDVLDCLRARRTEEQADVLGFKVQRVDETSYPHYLQHIALPGFSRFWESITCRDEPEVILSMFGTGNFWTRQAFERVARLAEPFPIYLELFLPTAAHHLGFRVRDLKEQNRMVSNKGDFSDRIDQARQEGLWSVHPIKDLAPDLVEALLDSLKSEG